LVLFLVSLVPLYSQDAPTLETILRAVQERHLALEQRDAIREILNLQEQQEDYGPVATFTNQVELIPIDWGHGLDPMPDDGTASNLSLEQRMEVLSIASQKFDYLKNEYLNINLDTLSPDNSTLPEEYLFWGNPEVLFSLDHLPTIGLITPQNFQQAQLELAGQIHRLRVIQWPVMYYRVAGLIGFGKIVPVDEDDHNGEHEAEWKYYINEHNEIDYGLGGRALSLTAKPQTFDHEEVRSIIQIPPGAPSELAMQKMSVHAVTTWTPPEASIKLKPSVLHYHRYRDEDDVVHEQYFDVAGNSTSLGFFYRMETGDELHPDGVQGEIYQFSKSDQYIKNGYSQTIAVTHQQNWSVTEEGYWDSQHIVPQKVLYGDPLTLNTSDSTVTFHLGDQASDVNWEESLSNDRYVISPSYSDPEFPALVPHLDYVTTYKLRALFKPTFQELSDPLPHQTTGPGTLGSDYPEHGINTPGDGAGTLNKQEAYAIELGDGRHTRGNQGRLAIRYRKFYNQGTEEIFHILFLGDKNEYTITKPDDSTTRYVGGLVQTDVEWVNETTVTVTQSLVQALPDQLGTANEEIKKFTFVVHDDVSDLHTQLTCKYSFGSEHVIRNYVLTPNDVYFGADRANAPYRLNVVTDGDGVRLDVYSNGQLVRKAFFFHTHYWRFGSQMTLDFADRMDLPLDGNWLNARFYDVIFHPNDFPHMFFWDGPGAWSATYDTNGTLISRNQGPSAYQAEYTTGDTFTSTEKYSGSIVRQSQLQWSGPGSYTVSDLIPSNGRDTSISLWDPEDEEFPSGQIPWAVRQIEYANDTVLTSRDILSDNNRVTTVFQGTLDSSGEPEEGVRTVTVYNRLGGVKSRISTWIPDGLILSSNVYEQSRIGPTKHIATDGFEKVMEWNAAGELDKVTGRKESLEVVERDEIGRALKVKDLHTNAETTRTPNGNEEVLRASSGGFTHTVTNTWNDFGDMTNSVFKGSHAQDRNGSNTWSDGVWTGGGENAHTHAESISEFDEMTLSSVIRSKTGTGQETSVTYEMLGGVPCLRIDVTVHQPGLAGGANQLVSRTYVDGVGRTRRVQTPDPSQPNLVWQNTDYEYDAQGRLKRIDYPVTPDVLISYDSLSRVYQQALDLNGNGVIDPGTDRVTETSYGVQNQKWVETTELWIDAATKKVHAEEQTDPRNRSFTQKIGSLTPDTVEASTVASGVQTLAVNGRTVVETTPTQVTVKDNSNEELTPISQVVSTVNALGDPVSLDSSDGPMVRQVIFNENAQPSAVTEGGISTTLSHDYQPDGSSTHSSQYGALQGPSVSLDPAAETSDIGGGGGMPHDSGLDWLPGGGWKKTLSLAGGNESEWHINPAGLVTKKVFANGDEESFVYDGAGRLLTKSSPSGNQTWSYTPHGTVDTWKLDGQTKFDVLNTDPLGRITEIKDDSGTRSLVYDNDKWRLDTTEWTEGILTGYLLDENTDNHGRLEAVAVSKNGTDLYTSFHVYRGESEHIDAMIVTIPGAPFVQIEVDGVGGKADTFTYSVNGVSTSFSRGRDVNGRVNAITAPGLAQNWNWDDMGRTSELTTNGILTTFEYDDQNGSLASVTTDGEEHRFTFNDRGELEEEEVEGEELWVGRDPNQSGAISGRANLRKLKIAGSFHTNAVLQVLVGTNEVYSTTTTPFTFTFDETTVPALTAVNAVVGLDWSVVGTRPEEPGGTDYEGDNAVAEIAAGRYLFAPAAESITYDISIRRSSDAFLDYEYDTADQPTSLEQRHGSYRTEHVYDGSQRRVEKRVYVNNVLKRKHRYVYQGWLPVVEEVTNRFGNLEWRNSYVWGPNPGGVRMPGIGATGQLALIIHQPKQGSPQLSAPVYNHRQDIVALFDVETGSVVARYGYTPFGKTRYAFGSRVDQNPFRFAGAYFDAETQTYYFGYRHYDPRTKQWLTHWRSRRVKPVRVCE